MLNDAINTCQSQVEIYSKGAEANIGELFVKAIPGNPAYLEVLIDIIHPDSSTQHEALVPCY
jgi:hypothetical protein